MEAAKWIASNWFELFQSATITFSILFAAFTRREDIKTRRADHHFEISKQHREIWSEIFHRPELQRIDDVTADLKQQPVSPNEELFVVFLIFHLNASYQAIKNGVLVRPEGLRWDIKRFFARPIPRSVWEKVRPFHDAEFVGFVDNCILDSRVE